MRKTLCAIRTRQYARGNTFLNFFISGICFVVCALGFAFPSEAKEVTIFYSGTTHAMLYPCNCPLQPDGGIARRSTLIKRLKEEAPDSLILDSGNFFAGGTFDEYAQNTQLDLERTKINIKAMDMMGFDAAAVSDDEFNFGLDFLKESTAKAKFKFLSCNVKIGAALPYLLKEVAGVKFGLIGVTSPNAKKKAVDLEIFDPRQAVNAAITELKKKGAEIIVLLSSLNEAENTQLASSVSGVDVLIGTHNLKQKESFAKFVDTIFLRPSWQGRRLDRVVLKIENNKISDYKVEEIRLSSEVADDPGVASILPACFSDDNCKKEGALGICQNAGGLNSRCFFSEANKVDLTVITARGCAVCNHEVMVNSLKKQFPGLVVSYLYYPDKDAKKLVSEFAISGLPAYLLGREIEKEKVFDKIAEMLERKGGFYVIKPEASGVSYIANRQKKAGEFDLFLSLYEKEASATLEVVKDFNPKLHFLAVEKEGKFETMRGKRELEEYLLAVCVQKYSPSGLWDYLICRSKQLDTFWWDECAKDMDIEKIKTCAKTDEGISLLKENISLNKELKVLFGPTYLMDNQQIFASKGVPKKEDLDKIIEEVRK